MTAFITGVRLGVALSELLTTIAAKLFAWEITR